MLRRRFIVCTLCLLMLAPIFTLSLNPTATTFTRSFTQDSISPNVSRVLAPAPLAANLTFQRNIPELTQAQLQQVQTFVAPLALPRTPSGNGSYLGLVPSVEDLAPQLQPQNLTDFQVFANITVGSLSSAPKSLVNEPSVAQKNQIIFYTGNWYAARSTDSGVSWSYVNPFSNMSDFCCDQDTIYNPSRGIFLWYRMGRPQANGTNRFFLGVSTDAEKWFFYNITPTMINSGWTTKFFDFMIMAYSDNYLYLTTNLFDGISQKYFMSLILRLSLNNLKNHNSFTFDSYAETNEGFAPVQGAGQTMYFATHPNTVSLQLYVWNESSPSPILPLPIFHPQFTATAPGNATCPAPPPDGGDICKRLDDRILGGWVSKGVIGFFWNVAQGGAYAKPYTYIIRLNETTKALIDTPNLASSDAAWVYTWISPNARGDLGVIAFSAGSTRYPTLYAGILDAYSAPWHLYHVATSTNGPQLSCINGSTNPCWGDFIRVRPFNGTENSWVATGYTLQGGADGGHVVPRYVVFGRVRDYPFNNALVEFQTIPSVVGSITFNGTTYKNGDTRIFNLTFYSAHANVPVNYTFSHWNATGGVSVSNSSAITTNVTLSGIGNLTMIMIPPNITVTFRTNPSNIGSITCSGRTFTNGQMGRLPANSSIPCNSNPSSNYHFTSWGGLASGSAQAISLFTASGGTLTANFTPAAAAINPTDIALVGLLAGCILWARRRRSSYPKRSPTLQP